MSFEDVAHDFRTRFPDGGLYWCDYRPHIDGYVINAYSAILPMQDEATTRKGALVLLGEITSWLQQHSGVFGAMDRLNLVIGFPESVKRTKRQIFKCRLPASSLAELHGVDFAAVGGVFYEMEWWSVGVAWHSAD